MRLNLIIDRFEGDKVVFKTENNATIVWPKDALPENIHEGMVLTFTINNSNGKEDNDKRLAKDILNEILQPE
ncbi:hypothetical protein A2303_00520 [Candidatus Falkowbacteria bacterium RIFOXYB2_FULL_47_14]|uniref:DUF3006 domain-containing protein n=1 Tax=Candidatus Falkowbacteria bacterium RIFOXYA2_FULL_47_19 TaxID=1797994 RepID=A0A1F5SMD7_9BACT|nr:MAG: hypothetical protein A2227_03925 [Candidatus Falkowbacteria bacterium RIFOXYA2_FULL_47_19]OGF34699.1 MAG: hypothetical protein A2468_02470 [Candidatus Falkowbacteria bacterium RIFOXYC2_FULL_46_15]OGF42856.1 MAG: hypothetical protein A2303_00520 [Candidatus Falkowbacteria bacterium RIFOXYB2_FULL_47_14]